MVPPRLNGAPLPSVGKECGCHAAASNGHKGMSLRGRWGRPKTVHRPDENRTIPYTNRTPPYTPTRVRDTLKTPARGAYAETVWHRPGNEALEGGFLEYRLPQWMPAREQPAGMVITFEKTMVLRQRPFRFGWGPFQSRTLPHKIRTHPHTATRVREKQKAGAREAIEEMFCTGREIRFMTAASTSAGFPHGCRRVNSRRGWW